MNAHNNLSAMTLAVDSAFRDCRWDDLNAVFRAARALAHEMGDHRICRAIENAADASTAGDRTKMIAFFSDACLLAHDAV